MPPNPRRAVESSGAGSTARDISAAPFGNSDDAPVSASVEISDCGGAAGWRGSGMDGSIQEYPQRVGDA